MEKTITRERDGRFCRIEIRLTDDRLSIVGVSGRVGQSGAFLGESWGQIREDLTVWFPEFAPYFRWHLNDMHAECEHQEARGESWTTHPMAQCPDCGYRLGSQWLKRELPTEVREWFATLQSDATIKHIRG
jgi:hypothetical protein